MFRIRTLVPVALLCATVTAVPAEAAKRAFGSRTLHQGMHGHDVRVLQDFLNRYGLRVAIDGWYGPTTTKRVRAWERKTARRVDGRVSRADASVLRSHVEAGGASFRPTPPPPPAVEKARLLQDGTAVAPAGAPPQVQAIIAAGNEIASKPYRYGGGHGRWDDSGYDCSGSISYALHGAGLLDTALDSSGFMRWGSRGKGRWVTIYAHGGHAYMTVAGLRFDTSGARRSRSRWKRARGTTRGDNVRHPAGL